MSGPVGIIVGIIIVLLILGAFGVVIAHNVDDTLKTLGHHHTMKRPVVPRPGAGGHTNAPLVPGAGGHTNAPLVPGAGGKTNTPPLANSTAEGFVGAYGRSPQMEGCISWGDDDMHRIPSFNRCSYM